MAPRAANLIKDMADHIFEGVETKPAGMAYRTLCEAFPLEEIKDSKQHKTALEIINRIMNFISSEHEGMEAYITEVESYLNTLSTLVETFEKQNFPKVGKASAAEVLSYLMESHNLKQSDLKAELGGQSVVSDILNGKRLLNLKQIRALAKRFNLSPGAFIST